MKKETAVQNEVIEELEAVDDDQPAEVVPARKKVAESKKTGIFLILSHRAVTFFFLLLCAEFILFAIANAQYFLESNIKAILWLTAYTSIALILFSLAAAAAGFLSIFTEKKLHYILYTVTFVVPLAVGIAGAVFCRSLLILSDGI